MTRAPGGEGSPPGDVCSVGFSKALGGTRHTLGGLEV